MVAASKKSRPLAALSLPYVYVGVQILPGCSMLLTTLKSGTTKAWVSYTDADPVRIYERSPFWTPVAQVVLIDSRKAA